MPDADNARQHSGRRLLVCHLRPARLRARTVAVAEICALLEDLGVAAERGGPLAEQRGVFWVSLPDAALVTARARLPRLGYTVAVDLLVPLAQADAGAPGSAQLVRWHGRDCQLVRLYEEDEDALRERAVDRRVFLLDTPEGVRPTRGYRGSSAPLSRRGLPVADARLLVNLAGGTGDGFLLEAFAGAGGVVIETLTAGWRCLSVDRDPRLRHGLAALSQRHLIADARRLPLAGQSVAAIATEPPYEPAADDAVCETLSELRRVLQRGGRLVLLCVERQAEPLRRRAAELGLQPFLDAPIDRKGLTVVVLGWQALF